MAVDTRQSKPQHRQVCSLLLLYMGSHKHRLSQNKLAGSIYTSSINVKGANNAALTTRTRLKQSPGADELNEVFNFLILFGRQLYFTEECVGKVWQSCAT